MTRRQTERNAVMPRLIVSVAVFALLAGNFGSLLHMAAVHHIRCPEHGELINITAAHFDAAALPSPEHLESGQPTWVAQTRPRPDGEQHHHCAVSATCRQQHASPEIGPAASQAVVDTSPGQAPAADDNAGAVAVYLVAPKHSPPALCI